MYRHEHPDDKDAHERGEQIDRQHGFGLAKTVQHTAEQAVHIHHGAEPGELADQDSGKQIVKEYRADERAGYQE